MNEINRGIFPVIRWVQSTFGPARHILTEDEISQFQQKHAPNTVMRRTFDNVLVRAEMTEIGKEIHVGRFFGDESLLNSELDRLD